MANGRNIQLKVYNHWTGGLENKVEEHLIKDVSFTSLNNLDNSTGSLRPVRSNKQYKVLADGTTDVVKEHVVDCEAFVEFNTTIEFVNYGDTLYYVDTKGSPLKQLTKANEDEANTCDKPTVKHDTHLAITGTITSVGGGSLESEFSNSLQKVYSCYIAYKDNEVSNYQYYSPNAGLNDMANSFNVAITNVFNNYLTSGEITADTIGTELARHEALQKDIVTVLTDRITHMAGTLESRLRVVRDVNVELKTFFNSENELRYIDTLVEYIDKTNPEPRSAGYVIATMMNFNSQWVQMLTQIKEDSVSDYILWKFRDNHSGYKGTLKKVLERALSKLKILQTAYVTYLETNNPWESNRLTDVIVPAYTFAKTTLGEQDANFLLSVAIVANANTSTGIATLLDRSNTGANKTQTEAYYSNLRNAMATIRTCVEDVKLSIEIGKNIQSYAVVGYNEVTHSYSNILKINAIYNNGTVTLTGWDSNSGVTKWYVYRKLTLDETEYQKVGETTGTEIEILNSALNGGALSFENQSSEPIQDFIDITEHKGVIFAIRKNSQQIVFMEKNYPNRVAPLNFINASQNVKAITSNGAGVVVWTTNRTVYLLTIGNTQLTANGVIDTKDTIAIKRIAQNVGILDARAKTVNDNNVIWLSQYGFHNTSGYGSASVTADYWEVSKGLVDGTVIQMLTIDDTVWTLYTPKIDGTDQPNKLIKFEPRKRSIREFDSLGITSISEIEGKLHGVVGNNAVEMFAGDELVAFTCKLKRFAGYSFDVRKRFMGLMIAHDDKPYRDIDRNEELKGLVRIFIDCREVGTQEIFGCDTTEVELPNNNNQGYSIHVELEGTLKINSVRLKYLTHQWED